MAKKRVCSLNEYIDVPITMIPTTARQDKKADKPARRCWNSGHELLKGIESDTIR